MSSAVTSYTMLPSSLEARMLAAGCLMPLVLLAAGAVVGSAIGGSRGGTWGSIIGFAAGSVILLGLLWAMQRVRRN
jgi:membrane protein implicated in regulation of membrane protease activity